MNSILSPAVPFRYGPSVFLAGAVTLFIELAGSKLMAPVYGSALYVWSAMITVTLLAVATGAWAGGWLADRKPESAVLSMLWMETSLALGAVVPLRRLVFPLADRLDLRAGVLLTSLALFFLPLALLSAVSPLAVKLSRPDSQNLGRTVGEVSAVGTAGGCFGALLTGFFLVPHFPLIRLFFVLSLLLAFREAFVFLKQPKKAAIAVLWVFSWGIALYFLSAPKALTGVGGNGQQQPVLASETRQSLYGQVEMVEIPSFRLLFLDGAMQAGVKVSTMDSMTQYAAAMEVLGLAAAPKARRALVVGLGGGVLPALLFKRGLRVDTAEINPQVAEMCGRWFNLPPRPAELHLEDGRRFLRGHGENFDLIFMDAFASDEIPAHLMTREAFQEARARLSPDGVLVVNYLGFFQRPSSRVLSTIAETLKTVYPSVETFTTGYPGTASNFFLVARSRGGDWDRSLEEVWGGGAVKVSDYLDHPVKLDEPFPFLFTDDFCPMEWLDRVTHFLRRKESAKVIPMSTFGF